MERTCFYLLLGSTMLVSVMANSCNCTCGNFNAGLSSTCYSAPSCASTCRMSYHTLYGCDYNNTSGCCGNTCSNYTQSYCRCTCGSSIIVPDITCSSSLQCGFACASRFNNCGSVNPYGCCDNTCDSYVPSTSCTCYCGSSTYYMSANFLSAYDCASTCISTYGNCLRSNTYGCCGSSCRWFSSPSTTSTCNCLCSIANSTLPYSVGSTSLTSCTTSFCQSYCGTTYSASCGTYINNAFCLGTTTSGIATETTSSTHSDAATNYPTGVMFAIPASLGVLVYFNKDY